MPRRNIDPAFDDEEIENEDPLGEQAFEAGGFQDGPGGEPDFDAGGLEDGAVDKTRRERVQKVAGIPESRQHEQNTRDLGRPDSEGVVIRERGGEAKGDPAVGGTRELG